MHCCATSIRDGILYVCMCGVRDTLKRRRTHCNVFREWMMETLCVPLVGKNPYSKNPHFKKIRHVLSMVMMFGSLHCRDPVCSLIKWV